MEQKEWTDQTQTIHRNDFIDYKDILLFDKTIRNTLVIVKVPFSRFRIILNNYHDINGQHVDPDYHPELKYNDYMISQINERNNAYHVYKTCSPREERMLNVERCSCGRLKKEEHDKCYYCQRIEKNYTTKIVDDQPEQLNKPISKEKRSKRSNIVIFEDYGDFQEQRSKD